VFLMGGWIIQGKDVILLINSSSTKVVLVVVLVDDAVVVIRGTLFWLKKHGFVLVTNDDSMTTHPDIDEYIG
jgi:hypothetical protein